MLAKGGGYGRGGQKKKGGAENFAWVTWRAMCRSRWAQRPRHCLLRLRASCRLCAPQLPCVLLVALAALPPAAPRRNIRRRSASFVLQRQKRSALLARCELGACPAGLACCTNTRSMMQHSSSCATLRGGAAEAASAACRGRCADTAARTAPAARRRFARRCAAPRCAAHTAHQPLPAAADDAHPPLGALRRRRLLASLAAAAVAAALPAPRASAAAEDALREATFDQLEAFAKARAFILSVVVLHTQSLC
jgi:hypothetical protein